jgi:hypothetical protein
MAPRLLIAAERVLGLDGPAAGGLYAPDTLVPPQAAVVRRRQFGVRIRGEEGGAS